MTTVQLLLVAYIAITQVAIEKGSLSTARSLLMGSVFLLWMEGIQVLERLA